jgi:hypothetical protein
MTAAEDTQRYRERKRAKGECIKGGCHERAAKAGMCIKCYEHAKEQQHVYLLERMSVRELRERREHYLRFCNRVEREMARRGIR